MQFFSSQTARSGESAPRKEETQKDDKRIYKVYLQAENENAGEQKGRQDKKFQGGDKKESAGENSAFFGIEIVTEGEDEPGQPAHAEENEEQSAR